MNAPTDCNHPLRAACVDCGGMAGRIETRNGQDCVFCACGRHQYNAPKTETGRAVRSTQTVHEAITPKIRVRVLQQANGHCELCGKSSLSCVIHVGHILSVEAGLKAGFTEVQLNESENLCAMCDECNLGLGKNPVLLKVAIRLLMIHHGLISVPGPAL